MTGPLLFTVVLTFKAADAGFSVTSEDHFSTGYSLSDMGLRRLAFERGEPAELRNECLPVCGLPSSTASRGRHIVFVSKTAYGRATVPLFSSQVCELLALISVHVPKS